MVVATCCRRQVRQPSCSTNPTTGDSGSHAVRQVRGLQAVDGFVSLRPPLRRRQRADGLIAREFLVLDKVGAGCRTLYVHVAPLAFTIVRSAARALLRPGSSGVDALGLPGGLCSDAIRSAQTATGPDGATLG